MKWNSKDSTYVDAGKKSYSFGDPIPPAAIESMGKPTVKEYTDKGWLLDDEAAAESERDTLFKYAKSLGLRPHYKAGVAKINEMIDDFKDLEILRLKAADLGLEKVDGLDLATLTELVEAKKADNESDSAK